MDMQPPARYQLWNFTHLTGKFWTQVMLLNENGHAFAVVRRWGRRDGVEGRTLVEVSPKGPHWAFEEDHIQVAKKKHREGGYRPTPHTAVGVENGITVSLTADGDQNAELAADLLKLGFSPSQAGHVMAKLYPEWRSAHGSLRDQSEPASVIVSKIAVDEYDKKDIGWGAWA